MIQRVLTFVKKYHMIEEGDHIVVGVSGGADSVCLLLVLLELQKRLKLQKQIPFTLEAAHIEHGIRGEESLADARFVRELCGDLQIPFFMRAYPVEEIAKRERLSVEEAGRKVRYGFFEERAAAYPQGKIAIAHNLSDNAETMLFQMARGSGLRGMCGIAPKRGQIIRPLLCVSRQEIEDYLEGRGQSYCVDCTNLEDAYARNKIRHNILPVLQEVNSQAVEHFFQAGEKVSDTVEYLDWETQQIIGQAAQRTEDGILLNRQEMQRYPKVLKQTVLHKLLTDISGSSKDLTSEHVNSVLALLEKGVGRSVDLPYQMTAENRYEELWIHRRVEESGTNNQRMEASIPITIPGKIRLQDGKATLNFRIIELNDKNCEIPKKAYTKWLDYDKIRGNLQARTRMSGDFFTIDELGNRQMLKKYFINEKVPLAERDATILVAEGHHILWAVGYRISADCKVTKDTKKVLEIQFNGGNEHE